MTDSSLHNINELFRQVAAGDSKAFTEIFYHFTPKLHPFVLKKVQDPFTAEEIIQDVFLKIWMNRERLQDVQNPQGYIYRIASNAVLDHFKKLASEYRMLEQQEGKEDNTTTPYPIQYKETTRYVNEAVRQLPAKRQKIYLLREEGLSYDEIADLQKISISTAKNQMVSALKYIRNYLLEKGISPVLIIWIYFLSR